jgi:hypothetical protein
LGLPELELAQDPNLSIHPFSVLQCRRHADP